MHTGLTSNKLDKTKFNRKDFKNFQWCNLINSKK